MTAPDIVAAEAALNTARAAEDSARAAFDTAGTAGTETAFAKATAERERAERHLGRAHRLVDAAAERARQDKVDAMRAQLVEAEAAVANLTAAEAELTRDWAAALLESLDREAQVSEARAERTAALQRAAALRGPLGRPRSPELPGRPAGDVCDILEDELPRSSPTRQLAIRALVSQLEPGRARLQMMIDGVRYGRQLTERALAQAAGAQR